MNVFVLNDKPYPKAKNLPVIGMELIYKEIDFSNYDGVIFTSKKAVVAIDTINRRWRDLSIYTIGVGTEEAVREAGAEVEYCAKSSYGDDFANELKSITKGKKLIYLRPEVVISKLAQILKEESIEIDEEVIYKTVCTECGKLKTPPKNSAIIFSSPSTIECFFNCFEWDESYRAIVIGKNTASYMPQNIDFTLSKEQNIPSCIELGSSI